MQVYTPCGQLYHDTYIVIKVESNLSIDSFNFDDIKEN
jgi:hypothetical protein